MRRIRSKIDNLLVYHHNLDSNDTINLVKGFKRGDLVFIRKFITKENVNSSIGIFGYFPLELTIIYDQKHVFEYLVNELGANVNIKNKSLETMHFVALAFQRRNYLFELLNLDMNNLYECTNGSQRTLMHEAAICGDGETVYRLLNEYGKSFACFFFNFIYNRKSEFFC
jgi:ankyrin repeat protein